MTLFDTSVILDARDSKSPFYEWAKNQIAEAVAANIAFANTIVISESSVRALNPDSVPILLEKMGLTLLPLPISAAVPAAKAFAVGKTSAARAPLPDFLIGAHAEAEGFVLVTRGPDRIRTYFPGVKLITP